MNGGHTLVCLHGCQLLCEKAFPSVGEGLLHRARSCMLGTWAETLPSESERASTHVWKGNASQSLHGKGGKDPRLGWGREFVRCILDFPRPKTALKEIKPTKDRPVPSTGCMSCIFTILTEAALRTLYDQSSTRKKPQAATT